MARLTVATFVAGLARAELDRAQQRILFFSGRERLAHACCTGGAGSVPTVGTADVQAVPTASLVCAAEPKRAFVRAFARRGALTCARGAHALAVPVRGNGVAKVRVTLAVTEAGCPQRAREGCSPSRHAVWHEPFGVDERIEAAFTRASCLTPFRLAGVRSEIPDAYSEIAAAGPLTVAAAKRPLSTGITFVADVIRAGRTDGNETYTRDAAVVRLAIQVVETGFPQAQLADTACAWQATLVACTAAPVAEVWVILGRGSTRRWDAVDADYPWSAARWRAGGSAFFALPTDPADALIRWRGAVSVLCAGTAAEPLRLYRRARIYDATATRAMFVGIATRVRGLRRAFGARATLRKARQHYRYCAAPPPIASMHSFG
jgi:hypothetical protein